MKINNDLLKKYNVNGPRYTSYPPATQFRSSFQEGDYLWHVEHSNQDPLPKPLSLYLHIPFCQSLCYFCGCHKLVTHNSHKVSEYLCNLHQEIRMQSDLFDKDRELIQIHFGGGTPTYLSVHQIGQLLQTIDQHFSIPDASDTEISIEIDPRTTTEDDIRALAAYGFNRMSFGIQDFNRDVQVAINRIQDEEQTRKLLRTASQAGVTSISTDIIYGLPKQTTHSFEKTLHSIIEAAPNRIALYNYAHMPERIKAQKMINEEDLPNSDTKLALMSLSINTLLEAGYIHIGMDHFALPQDPLSTSLKQGKLHRNFQGYSTHGDCDLIGCGVSAISRINDAYSQNEKELKHYNHSINQQHFPVVKGYSPSLDDKIRFDAIQKLMCNREIYFTQFNHAHKINFNDYFSNELRLLLPMVNEELLIIDNIKIKITTKGCLFLRNIAMVFDTHLMSNNSNISLIQFSKVI